MAANAESLAEFGMEGRLSAPALTVISGADSEAGYSMSHNVNLGSIFPLPLIPFESMMVRDDRDDYPMTCGAEFRFSGNANRAALEQALRQTVRRHPLFASLVRRRNGGQLDWVWVDWIPPIRWLAAGQEDDFVANRPIDLSVEVGLRVSVVRGSNETRLRFDFHHACCDAAGGMAFVEDMLVFYALACGNSGKLVPRPLEPSSLARRGQLTSSATSLWSRGQSAAAAARKMLRLACQRSLPLAAARQRQHDAGNDWHDCRYIVRNYDEARIRKLRHAAARQESTLNDLLVKTLICTLHSWQVRQRGANQRGVLRVVVPVNLRDKEDAKMPACNKIGYAFFSARMRDVQNEARLLLGICRTMALSRRHRLPQRFVQFIALLGRLPERLFGCVFSAASCHATAVFTNLGDPTRRFSANFPRVRGRLVVGGLVLEGITSIAPIRPNTRAVFSMNTYANQLTMTARFDPAYFSRSDADYLLCDFAERALPQAQRLDL